MLVLADTSCNAAVIVTNVNIDCQVVCANDGGVYVCLEGVFDRVCVVSVYCKFAEFLEPYLWFLESCYSPRVTNQLFVAQMQTHLLLCGLTRQPAVGQDKMKGSELRRKSFPARFRS